ncbi:hypothetical protein DYI37_06420 [Fulvimarina endophytica]|uniref:Lipoprotein n=2 Tax=Fulvimarina endophytica TaxID=2293836 RepID=A0A371X894_9HYPH|nr:hypothetical protein DYI37_06420 [Fulvimarina endophytica]
MTMGLDGVGPIPPASVGSGGGVYGSPSVTASATASQVSGGYGGLAAPYPPQAIERLPDGYEPQPQPQSQGQWQGGGMQQASTEVAGLPPTPPAASPARSIQSAPLLAPPSSQASSANAPYESAPPAPAQDAGGSPDAGYEPPSQPDYTAPPAASSAPAQPAVQTAALSQTTSEVQFLPLVGAPNEQANLLAQALSEEAARSQITIRPSSDGRAPTRLKGYFDAFEDGGDSVLVYIWDVLDENDERIHRIQGQERFATTQGGAWAGVDRAVLDAVARKTLQEARTLPATPG